MTTPSGDKDIHAAISAVMSEAGYVQKRRGENLNYTYAGESSLIAAIRPAMVRHNITCYVIGLEGIKAEAYATAKGSQMMRTTLVARIRFTHAPSGTFIDVASAGEGADSGDKSQNKALTGAYKYALRQTFCMATGDDPDKFPSQQRAVQQRPAGERVDPKTGEITPAPVERKEEPKPEAKADPKPAPVLTTAGPSSVPSIEDALTEWRAEWRIALKLGIKGADYFATEALNVSEVVARTVKLREAIKTKQPAAVAVGK